MIGRALIALMVAVAAPATAQDDKWSAPPPAWEGSWKGTIGTLPVHLCLNNTPYEDQGAYYYHRHRALIPLELSKDRRSWNEMAGLEASGPRWTIANQGKDRLSGTWSHGKKSLPVALSRIGPASQEYGGPCGTLAFHKPRLGPMRTAEAKTSFRGQAITTLTFRPGPPFDNVEVKSFALNRGGAGVAKVNAALRAILPKAEGTGDWLDCMMSNANAHGSDGDFSDEIVPSMIGDRWLAARRTSDSSCGGVHPNTDIELLTYDLMNGTRVDPLDWFLPSAVKVTRYEGDALKSLTPAFRKALLAGHKPDDKECAGVVDDQEYWTVGIERGSLVFWPQLPRVAMACSEDFKLPFAKLAPWLDASGTAAVATLPR